MTHFFSLYKLQRGDVEGDKERTPSTSAGALGKRRNAAGSDKKDKREMLSWLIKNSPGIGKASSRLKLQRDWDVAAAF